MIAALSLVAPLLAAAKPKSNGSSAYLIIIVIGAGFYFLIYRPQQRKAKLAKEQVKTWDVGDEVLTAGGIVGHIIDIDGDRVTLETSVGASFVVMKQYIIRKLEEPEPEEPEEPDEDEGYEDEETGEYDDEPELAEGDDEIEDTEDDGDEAEDDPAEHGGAAQGSDEAHGPDANPAA
jgi:preprotein translocase subunit YajC